MAEAADARPTGEVVVAQLLGQSGRRAIDWRAVFTFNAQVAIWFYLLGWLLDENHKPSCSRIGLTAWTILGWVMVLHEIHLNVHTGQVPLANAVWSSWGFCEGAFIVAVFGPRVASYFAPGAAGAVAMAGVPASVREAIQWGRNEAATLGHAGTEYDASDK